MKESTRIISALLCVLMIIGTIFFGRENTMIIEEEVVDNDSLIVWYTDDTLTDYLNSMAVEYHETYGVRVIPKLQTGNDYIESIYQASVQEESGPDVFLINSDSLEKAYLSGCAVPISDSREIVSETNFPKAALDAVTYKNQLVAYPYYFETTALLYNETYLQEMAANIVQAENATEPGEDGEEAPVEVKLTKAEQKLVDKRVKEAIPKTFDEFLTFADEFDAPVGVETIFKWDVRDIFYNYFFVGDYIEIGGDAGDNADIIDIYNIDAIKALTVFQELNQFFSFDSSDVTYDQIMDEFIQGKLVFATVTVDALKRLDDAKAAGEFPYNYGLTMIPDLNETMYTRSMSETAAIVINGYSNKKDRANAFAQFVSVGQARELFDHTGKLPTKLGTVKKDEPAYAFVQEYEYSAPMPKMMATSNCWLLMEGTFADIWAGKDVSSCLKLLSEQIKKQITGSDVVEEYINPPKKEEEVEYFDEEALMEAARNEGATVLVGGNN